MRGTVRVSAACTTSQRTSPGITAPRNETVQGLVQSVDLFPTMPNLAGLNVPDYAQSKDLLAWLRAGTRQPLHEAVFAQVGNYRGELLGHNTFPTGTCSAGRRKELVQGVRTTTHAYLSDTEYGDGAYDLLADPLELNNVLGHRSCSEAGWCSDLRRLREDREQQCTQLHEQLNVVPGNRGFDTPYRPCTGNRTEVV